MGDHAGGEEECDEGDVDIMKRAMMHNIGTRDNHFVHSCVDQVC